MLTMMWKWTTGLALVLVTTTVLWARSGPGPDDTKRYDTYAVDRGTVVAKITATGRLSALVTVQVGSQVSGRIRELHADFNAEVKKGAVLARLDPPLFEAALAEATANHAAARANLARARAQAEEVSRSAKRSRRLADRKLIAPADAESAEASAQVARADVDAAKAGLLQARAALEHARINLGYTTIVSPIDGVVISRNVDVGQTVAASLQAPVLFEIAEDLRHMQVDTSVAEADIGALRGGLEATFTVDAFPGRRFIGTVRQIRNAATMVQNVVTYDAVIDVANSDLALKPGMTANVTFVVARRTETLRVKNASLRFRLGGQACPNIDRKCVYVLRDGVPRRVAVQIGISDGRYTEVVAGQLKIGDAVVVGQLDPDRDRRSGLLGIL